MTVKANWISKIKVLLKLRILISKGISNCLLLFFYLQLLEVTTILKMPLTAIFYCQCDRLRVDVQVTVSLLNLNTCNCLTSCAFILVPFCHKSFMKVKYPSLEGYFKLYVFYSSSIYSSWKWLLFWKCV